MKSVFYSSALGKKFRVWGDFHTDGRQPQLASSGSDLLGQPLFDFVVGTRVTMIYWSEEELDFHDSDNYVVIPALSTELGVLYTKQDF